MSNEKLLLRYQKASEEIRRMEESSSRLKKLGEKEMDETKEKIRAGWDGENADAFLKKYDSLCERICSSASSLRVLAEEMRKSADRLKKADSRMADQISGK